MDEEENRDTTKKTLGWGHDSNEEGNGNESADEGQANYFEENELSGEQYFLIYGELSTTQA